MTVIRVTAQHVAAGGPGAMRSCPVALALREAFPEQFVRADYFSIRVGETFYSTPKAVGAFMRRFDHHCHDLMPFEFELPQG